MWMCWCVYFCSNRGPESVVLRLHGDAGDTDCSDGFVCLLRELTGYRVQAAQWRWSAGKHNICQSHSRHTKTHRDVRTSEERGELLAKTGDSWKKKRKKKKLFAAKYYVFVAVVVAVVHTFSQFAGLLGSPSRQDLGEHAFSLHARLAGCGATDTSRSRSCLGAWRGVKRRRAENRWRVRKEKDPFLIFLTWF